MGLPHRKTPQAAAPLALWGILDGHPKARLCDVMRLACAGAVGSGVNPPSTIPLATFHRCKSAFAERPETGGETRRETPDVVAVVAFDGVMP
jgi:hypothetical protein